MGMHGATECNICVFVLVYDVCMKHDVHCLIHVHVLICSMPHLSHLSPGAQVGSIPETVAAFGPLIAQAMKAAQNKGRKWEAHGSSSCACMWWMCPIDCMCVCGRHVVDMHVMLFIHAQNLS